MPTFRVLAVMDLRDRDLFQRWTLRDEAKAANRWSWIVVTHAGGAVATITSVLLPLVTIPALRGASTRAAVALTASHMIVQSIKRVVNRERPTLRPLIPCPDRFSFPSGHATAALAVALSYSVAFPSLAAPLIAFALLVGWSRVVLGVHYPGDVVVGQLIATATVAVMRVAG